MIDIPLPRLLDSNGNTAGYIHPISESINLEITPLSYASMVLPVGQSLPARSFVELFTNIGSVGIFRVRSPQDAYGEETTTAELEHAIVEVGDWLVRANISGTMTIQTAMTQVFSHYRGTKWQLGNISALGTDTIAVTIEYERVLDAMMKILAMKPECYLDFDFSTSPWTVSVNQRDTTVTAEGRLSRNVNSANVTYDDTDLCTRVYYPVDTVDSTTGATVRTWYSLDADTITTYGVAERSVYNADDTTVAEALRTAQEYLNLYKKPKFGVQISGEELSSITGESLDRFGIGKLFRLALTDYNTTIEQTITSLSWDDVYNAPTSVMVNLADEEAGTFDMVTALHEIDKNGGTASGGRGSSGYQFKNEMQGGQYKTKIDQTDRYIDLVAQKVNTAGDILQQAGLYLDSDGVLVYADDFENNLGAKLNVQANKIGMVVGTYQGRDYIKAGEIALAINDDDESVAHIDADHVNISATSTLHTLAGAIEEDDQGNVTIKSAGGMRVRKTISGITSEFGVFDENNLTAGVLVNKINGESNAYITADHVNVSATSTVHTLAGEMEVDSSGNLVIKSAGGMRVRKTVSGQIAEFGVFDENSLTAGVIVDRVNGGSVTIKGSKVWVGDAASDQTLKKWATESDGLFAQNIGALSARIGSIEADYINTNNLSASIANLSAVTVTRLNATAVYASGLISTPELIVGTRTLSPANLVRSVVGSAVPGGVGYQFVVTQVSGDSETYTFNVASSLTFGGEWTGASYTATAKDADDNVLGSVTTAINRDWSGTTLRIMSGTDVLLSEAITGGTGTGMSTQGTVYSISTFNSSHKAYGYVDAASHPAGRLFSFNVDATSEYNAGWGDYWSSGLWGRPGASTDATATVKIPGQTPTTGQVAWFILSTGETLTYDSSTHKYTAKGQAKIGSTVIAQSQTGTTSGTQAYDEAVTYWRPDSVELTTDKKKINILNAAGDTISGPYSVEDSYNAGWLAYYNSGYWGRPTASTAAAQAVLVPGRTPSSGSETWFNISSGSTIEYNSTTHKYTAKGQAKIGATVIAQEATGTESGTEAWDAVGLSSVTVSNMVRTGNTYTVYVNIGLNNGKRYNGYSAGTYTPS